MEEVGGVKVSIEAIKMYQKALGYDFDTMSLHKRMQSFRDYMAALVVEQGELATEVQWKPWRNTNQQKFNKRKALLEFIDCYFFLIDQGLALGFTAQEIEDTFYLKLNVNMERINSSYNNTKEERNNTGTE
jgi:dimeric dUTPase (all-alpha-NTP-PPase superfamily)